MRSVTWIFIWCALALISISGAWAVERYVVEAFSGIQYEQPEIDPAPVSFDEAEPLPTPPATEFIPAVPHKAPTSASAPEPPKVEVREELSEVSAGGLRIGWDESLVSYTAFNGSAKYPHEIVREILDQQRLGHLEYQVSIPAVQYRISSEQINETTYRVDPEHVSLAEDITVPIIFSLRYPALSDAQFAFLSDKKDYRFVYGLLRGVVEHEEMHLVALQKYAKVLEGILSSPLTSPQEISASSQKEFNQKAGDLVKSDLTRRLDTARETHDQEQYAIDNPPENPVVRFEFEEEVDGKIPSTLVAEFQGIATFSFTPLSSPTPRPPTPKL